MKKEILRFTLCALIVYLTGGTLNLAIAASQPSGGNGTHFCGVVDYQPRFHRGPQQSDKRYSDQFPYRYYAQVPAEANLNVGEPRTVRMIYFLPNDRPYRAEVVQTMKDEILGIQTFFAEQMEAHGYGNKTFRIETDTQGEPIVHRVDGQYSDHRYFNNNDLIFDEIEREFDLSANIYLIVIDNSGQSIRKGATGIGRYIGRSGGFALVNEQFSRDSPANLATHELGHVFGWGHDFRDGVYIMSYGARPSIYPSWSQLSVCFAEYLSVHPYFNPDIPIETGQAPSVELISSPQYPAESKSVVIQLKISDSEGLHQVSLSLGIDLVECRGLAGKKDAIVEFTYEGSFQSGVEEPDDTAGFFIDLSELMVHPIFVEVIDINGNVNGRSFVLFSETLQPLSKISGDNQHDLPNTPLPVPFVVEVRNLDDSFPLSEVSITFAVTAGGGTLSVEHTETDWNGRAKSTLTLGPDLGTNTVSVSAFGIEQPVTFNAVAGAAVAIIPDQNLRAAVENALGKAPGATIAVGAMERLTSFLAPNANITDLTGLEHATNLKWLNLDNNSISDISVVAGLTHLIWLNLSLNNISDISVVAGLTHLKWLTLLANNISDLSALAGLTDLTRLDLGINHISDLSALAGLTDLTELYLNGNSISDLSALAGLTDLKWLDLLDNNISDLSALAGLTDLIELDLGVNSISDLSALAGLTDLTRLDLGINHISDLSALAGLTDLIELNLWNSNISDLSALAGLTDLTRLRLPHNNISDLSALAGLTDLKWLDLLDNNISDLSALAGLTDLTRLDLGINHISDILHLVANTGLGTGDTVKVRGNPLNDASIKTHVPALQSRGVQVEFDIVVDLENIVVQGFSMPDPNLRAAIARQLVKSSETPIITTADVERLTHLEAPNANITDLTGLEHATNLTELNLGGEWVDAEGDWMNSNSVSNLTPLAGLTHLKWLRLDDNSISDLSALAGLTHLTELILWNNNISDLSALAGLTYLTELNLRDNSISDLSALAGLTYLAGLILWNNNISDISALAGLTHLRVLRLQNNHISDISALAGLYLTELILWNNHISDISALVGLTYLTELYLDGNSISDISPLVANTGLGTGDTVHLQGNPLNYQSIYTHIPALQNREVEVFFDDQPPTVAEYLLSIPAGMSLIHVPLKVTAVDGVEQTITLISDLYDALGGADAINFLITYDSQTQAWRSYFSASDKDTAANTVLTDDTGILANMLAPRSIRLSGSPLGTNGSSTITLNQGQNLVGLPLRDPRIDRVSDLFALDGIDNVPVILLTDGGDFKSVGRAGDPGDIPITGGQSFILTAQQAATVAISGEGWYNVSEVAAGPPLMAQMGIQATDTTPVLALKGSITSPVDGWGKMPHLRSGSGFRVIVKNLSTGRAVAAVTKDENLSRTDRGESMGGGYQGTIVDVETGRAAVIGDTLEISARSPSPLIGVEPLRYTVTAEDVKRSWIELPGLVAYEIPSETELLRNYPNPFNPETWIPYRLAEDAFATLTVYDLNGQVVRTLDVGHRIAAVYESRSKAVYWDGRNDVGEQVASGVYFYHLSAGDYSATRKMVILK